VPMQVSFGEDADLSLRFNHEEFCDRLYVRQALRPSQNVRRGGSRRVQALFLMAG
jgi:hypothetical protein